MTFSLNSDETLTRIMSSLDGWFWASLEKSTSKEWCFKDPVEVQKKEDQVPCLCVTHFSSVFTQQSEQQTGSIFRCILNQKVKKYICLSAEQLSSGIGQFRREALDSPLQN